MYRTNTLGLLPFLIFSLGVAPSWGNQPPAPTPGPCVKGPDCTAVDYKQFTGRLQAGPADVVFGCRSIGHCVGVDDCQCFNYLWRGVRGVNMVPKGPGLYTVWAYSQDDDYYWLTDANEAACNHPDMESDEGLIWETRFFSQVDMSVPGTRFLYIGFELQNEDPVGCEAWLDDTYFPATGYIHVYEITLSAEPTDSVPMTITWGLTSFTKQAVDRNGVTIDVTPSQMKIRVQGPPGKKAEAGPLSGYGGSVVWDGQWASGGSWDEEEEIEIWLEMIDGPLTEPYGMTSVLIDVGDVGCAIHNLSSVAISKKITAP